jgi:hypothetical protein
MSAATPMVQLPQLAVPGHALVVPLPCRRPPAELLADWLTSSPGLRPHASVLAEAVAAAAAQPQVGEVAAFLLYDDAQGRLVGGPAVLALELTEPVAGSSTQRVEVMTDRLRASAREQGHVDGLSQVDTRSTASGVPATRLQFLGADPGCAELPLVEACRWLYPVPGHPDLVWSLFFQTTDLDRSDELIEQFDAMADSLTWTDP